MTDFLREGPKGTMTSEAYTQMVEQIEVEIKRVKAENNPDNKAKLADLKKEKRALKNKASAMRCREKKRRKMDELERIVEELNSKLSQLEQENKQLRAAVGGAGAPGASAPVAEATVAPAAESSRRSMKKEPVAPAPRIHYTAPQKRSASDVIIADARGTLSSQPAGGLEKSTKMSHSRTHAVFAPIQCQVLRASEDSASKTFTVLLSHLADLGYP
jgi:outer membrane murein-binding lipoprotein Lpp